MAQRPPYNGKGHSAQHGRYVADVFYHPTIKKKEEVYEKGFFLNTQLLAEGLADAMV